MIAQSSALARLREAVGVDLGELLDAAEPGGASAASAALFARAAWDVAFFARYAMAEVLDGELGEHGPIDQWVYGLPPALPGERMTTERRLLLTGRGIGKTTRLKIRAFHGLLFGFVRVGVAIGATDEDAKEWVDTIREWASEPPPLVAAWFPELRATGNKHSVRLHTRFGACTLMARGWDGSVRGLNKAGVRPDSVYLDDIEKEENSKTAEARQQNAEKLRKKILPLEPIEGGGELWWAQTPVHHDGTSARVVKGAEDMRAWSLCRLPIVQQWPTGAEAEHLWAENRSLYADTVTEPNKQARAAAAFAHFEANAEAMSEGAVVLDPVRMPIWRCYWRRWDVGESAWATEYEVSTSPPGAGVFRPDAWPRFERVGSELHFGSHRVELRKLVLEAHYDPSDGGDDGALVVVAAWRGVYFVVASIVWSHARISEQIAAIPEALRFWAGIGLRELQWEPTAGSASEVERQIRKAIKDAGLKLKLVGRPSTERKEARIVATLEPVGAAGHLCLPHDISERLVVQASDFDPSSRRNRDDWLDALQRAIERHQARTARQAPDPAKVGQALRNAFRRR